MLLNILYRHMKVLVDIYIAFIFFTSINNVLMNIFVVNNYISV